MKLVPKGDGTWLELKSRPHHSNGRRRRHRKKDGGNDTTTSYWARLEGRKQP